jgi:hypothetical protein
MRLKRSYGVVAFFFLVLTMRSSSALEDVPASGWGVDAILTCAVPDEAVPAWLNLLKQSEVKILRERSTTRHTFDAREADFRPVYAQEKAMGFMVVAFGREIADMPGVDKRWGLSRDLGSVFAEGRRIGCEYGSFVDAWELHNEADVGYVPELPDRYTAHAKALYLGLKAGANEMGGDTPVILGALALPPGPWLERAAQNGVLDYADAYNFHYYGNPDELASHIRAHQHAQRVLQPSAWKKPVIAAVRPVDRYRYRSGGHPIARTLPLWLTECGVNATVPGEFFDRERRAFQAEFTLATAKQALAAPEVAVFMPFILVHKGDPHALVEAETLKPFPAWEAYSRFTRENPWPKRKLFDPAGERASPVVLQWLPTAGTATHKVAGTYRVSGAESITGEFKVYNFADSAVEGELTIAPTRHLSRELQVGVSDPGRTIGSFNLTPKLVSSPFNGVRLRVPAFGSVTVPVTYKPHGEKGYFREWTMARFHVNKRQVSQVAFGLERSPQARDFSLQRVKINVLNGESRLQPPFVNHEHERVGAWRVFNGLSGKQLEGERWRFSVGVPVNDPLAPTYALAAIQGVPEGARFLRLRLDRPMERDAYVRVDLVDDDGQRFTIWENLGMVYGETSRDVWLGIADFHPYLWSKAKAGDRRLRPEKVREIGLRVYLRKSTPLDVELDWALMR